MHASAARLSFGSTLKGTLAGCRELTIQSQCAPNPLNVEGFEAHFSRVNKETTMVRSLLIVIALFAVPSGAWAQNDQFRRPSAEDRACRGDAHRFCRDAIPDQFRVGSCLQEHRDRLSRGCRAMLEAHGM